jgi:hypothetical protein
VKRLKICLVALLLACLAGCVQTMEPPCYGQSHPANPDNSIAEPQETTTPLTVQEPPPQPADFEALRKLSRPAAEPGTSSGRTAAEPGAGTAYRCPMHSRVAQPKPGKCPICNTALVEMDQGGDQ